MKLCFCRFVLSAGILVVAIIAWGDGWAKIAVIIAAALLTLMSLAFNVCCCRKGKEMCATPAEEPKKED